MLFINPYPVPVPFSFLGLTSMLWYVPMGCITVVNKVTPASLMWHLRLATVWSHLLFQPYLPHSLIYLHNHIPIPSIHDFLNDPHSYTLSSSDSLFVSVERLFPIALIPTNSSLSLMKYFLILPLESDYSAPSDQYLSCDTQYYMLKYTDVP